MSPTLAPGDVLVVSTLAHPDAGDLVLVKWADRPLAVKRLMRREASGGWWVERDSRTAGIDSFSHGEVPPDGLHAVVLARIWPRPRRFRR